MSEWVTQPLAGAPTALFRGNRYRAGGLRTGASAAHILVFNRWVSERVSECCSRFTAYSCPWATRDGGQVCGTQQAVRKDREAMSSMEWRCAAGRAHRAAGGRQHRARAAACRCFFHFLCGWVEAALPCPCPCCKKKRKPCFPWPPPAPTRADKRVEEEVIDPVLVLAMRNMYQSR